VHVGVGACVRGGIPDVGHVTHKIGAARVGYLPKLGVVPITGVGAGSRDDAAGTRSADYELGGARLHPTVNFGCFGVQI